MIAVVNMDDFHSSVEQLDNPRLKGHPVAVVNGEKRGMIIATSCEARDLGIQTGMPWAEAHGRCPGCLHVVARPARYKEVSARILTTLLEVSPELEVLSIGETFLDLTRCQAYYRFQPEAIGTLIRETVFKASGLSCSVGISGDKTTARWASRQSQGGLTLVHPDEAETRLADIPLTELVGVGPGIAGFFAQYGVLRCGDMKKIPISVPAQRFGNLGRRLWLMAQARDPSAVDAGTPAPADFSLGRLLPPQTHELAIIQSIFMHMAEKLGSQLQRQGQAIQEIHVSMRCPEGWRQAWMYIEEGNSDGVEIFRACKRFLRQHWYGEVVEQIRIHAALPARQDSQPDFFAAAHDSGMQRPETAARAARTATPAAGSRR